MEHNRTQRMKLRSTAAFRDINGIWNHLHLNVGWCIGLITKIKGNQTFTTFEDWEKFYFDSAMVRQNLLLKESEEVCTRLMNLRAPMDDIHNFRNGLTRDQVSINDCHGRTLEELQQIGRFLYEGIQKVGNPFRLTEDDCFTFTYIRVVDEAFIGEEREMNTINTLKQDYPGLRFIKTDAYVDTEFAVDVEVFDGKNNRLCGIQIKSPSYKRNNSEILRETKDFNEVKNKRYESIRKVPCIYVYSTPEGKIINDDEVYYQLKNVKLKRV